MLIRGIPQADIERICAQYNIEPRFNGSKGRFLSVKFNLGPEKADASDKRSPKLYQRRSASWNNTERRVHAVCWHGFREALKALFREFPSARIKTAMAIYDGIDGFLATYPETGYRNIGAPIMPVQAREACFCADYGNDYDSNDCDECGKPNHKCPTCSTITCHDKCPRCS